MQMADAVATDVTATTSAATLRAIRPLNRSRRTFPLKGAPVREICIVFPHPRLDDAVRALRDFEGEGDWRLWAKRLIRSACYAEPDETPRPMLIYLAGCVAPTKTSLPQRAPSVAIGNDSTRTSAPV